MQPMINIAENAARQGAKIIMKSIDHLDTLEVTEKNRNEYATEVDRLTEKEIIRTIQRAYPDHGILAEESGMIGDNSDELWIIDPLDGTTNYIHGFPHFAISIAFQYQGKIEHALVYDPVRDEMFTASRGYGTRLNGRRIRVSNQRKMESALLGTGFPFRHSHHFKTYLKTFQAIFPQASGVRRAGSAALDLAYVAAGRLDGFWEISLEKWDMAAGALLIKEAGGLVSDFNGSEKYLENGTIIAGNPKIFKLLLQTIMPAMAENL